MNGAHRHGIARLNADGSLDYSFNSGIGLGGYLDWVSAVVVQSDGKVLIGGSFSTVDGTNRNNIARLNSDGTLDGSFNPGTGVTGDGYPSVNSLAVRPDGRVFIGGDFTAVNGTNRNRIARLNAEGGLDSSFNPGTGVNNSVGALAVQPDGKVLIGGDFTTVKDLDRSRIARLNADGSGDSDFDAGTTICCGNPIALQPDGKVLVGGSIARLNPNGSLESSFHPDLLFGVITSPYDSAGASAIAVQPDGKVLIGGDFTSVNGVVRPHVARLYGDSQLPVSFAAWAAGFSLSGAAAAAGADPDSDGMPNGAEYILGGNPTAPDTSGRPTVTSGGGNMVITFPRDDTSETPDVTLTVETGTDLVTWPVIFTIGPNTAASSPGVSITENGSAADTITVAIPQGTAPRIFARLQVMIGP